MNNKLLLSDVTDLLAQNAQISKIDAGAFLKVLFDIIEEQLLIDKIVKIKGLGTFKLIWVESRRIANVNTGEVQQISGHYKPTFTPDAALAEAVNEPFTL
jgi:nucleoid DNA-binding protein